MSWTTWTPGRIVTPWEFWVLEIDPTYKRKPGSISDLMPTADLIQSALQNQNAQILDEIASDFVQGLKLAAFVRGPNVTGAQQSVTELFPDALWHRVAPVDDATRSQLTSLLNSAGSRA